MDTPPLILGQPVTPIRLLHEVVGPLSNYDFSQNFPGTVVVTSIDVNAIGVVPAGLVRVGMSGGVTVWAAQFGSPVASYASWRGFLPLGNGDHLTVYNDITIDCSFLVTGWFVQGPLMVAG